MSTSFDHACPHLRETQPAEISSATVEPSPRASCPFDAGHAPSAPARLASTAAGGGGWWAFKAEALAMSARL